MCRSSTIRGNTDTTTVWSRPVTNTAAASAASATRGLRASRRLDLHPLSVARHVDGPDDVVGLAVGDRADEPQPPEQEVVLADVELRVDRAVARRVPEEAAELARR